MTNVEESNTLGKNDRRRWVILEEDGNSEELVYSIPKNKRGKEGDGDEARIGYERSNGISNLENLRRRMSPRRLQMMIPPIIAGVNGRAVGEIASWSGSLAGFDALLCYV